MNTNPKEFIKFYDLLMSNAPKGYTPWFFPVVENNKYPDALAIYKLSKPISDCCNANWIKIPKGINKIWACEKCKAARTGWKEPHARMTKEQCVQRLKEEGNIGLGARANDDLIIIDKDDPSVEDLKKETLMDTSRKRLGGHWFGWKGDEKIKTNIPTAEDVGEVRSKDQYVVCAGSYVPLNEEATKKLALNQQYKAGKYTCANKISPAILKFDDLPQVYKNNYNKPKPIDVNQNEKLGFIKKKTTGKYSAIFDLKMNDLITQTNARDPHPIHGIKDSAGNFSLSPNGEIAHCWRCLVSLNAIQYLAMKSREFGQSCTEVGTPHKGASKQLTPEMIFYAWRQAKLDGHIPNNDPIPTKALKYIAEKHLNIKSNNEKLPRPIYFETLKIVERDY